MKYTVILAVLLSLLTGCASTSNYTINGIEPGDNQMLKVVGTIVIAGVIAKSLSNGSNNYCSSTIKNNSGQTTGTISTVKSTPC